MPIKVLKQVIVQFRRSSDCPFCHSKFMDNNVMVLIAQVTTCLLFVICPSCSSQTFVAVELIPRNTKAEFDLKLEMTPGEQITHNEILDMKNFLKRWTGDIKDIV